LGTGKCRWTGWKTKQKLSVEQKRALVEPSHPTLRSGEQCQQLRLARSSSSYQPMPVSEEHLLLMRVLDEQYTRTPFSGSRKMASWLNTQGYPVERTRVRRLMQTMGLETISPKPKTSLPGPTAQKDPYVLRGEKPFMSIGHRQIHLCRSTGSNILQEATPPIFVFLRIGPARRAHPSSLLNASKLIMRQVPVTE
jgi:hypothetical protein